MSTQDILHIKCVILGESNIGKTSLITRYFFNKFHSVCESTIGCSFTNKKYIKDGSTYKLDVWDTAGQEKYRGLMPMYYRNADIVFICIDLSESHKRYINESFYYWEKQLESYCDNDDKILIVVGTKSDRKTDLITDEYIQSLCSKKNLDYFETSAKLNTGIDEMFKIVVDKAIVKLELREKQRLQLKDNLHIGGGDYISKTSKCC